MSAEEDVQRDSFLPRVYSGEIFMSVYQLMLLCLSLHTAVTFVPDMTYNVFGGTLNPTLLLLLLLRLNSVLYAHLVCICEADSILL